MSPTESTAPAAQPKAPLIGSDAQMAALRAALESSGYTDANVCQRLELDKIFDFRLLGDAYLNEDPPDILGKLIRLLMECGPVSRANAAGLPWDELEALGLVMPDPAQPGEWISTAMLYPIGGLYIASDRTRLAPHEKPQRDVVYPGVVKNTGLFLWLLPSTPCDAFLDLCAGTGIASMVAVRNGARHAYAYDVAPRSTHFAEFNRRLNAMENITVAQGDLYEPAGEMTFDRIAVHPPYVPLFRQHAIYDSGGQDGEQIVRRIIEGLPRYLRPGGRFYALTMGSDRQKPFEQRVREWLGEKETEFDVAFVVRQVLTPATHIAEAVVNYGGHVSDIPAWQKLFQDWGVRNLAYGLLTIQRRAERRPVFTVRRRTRPETEPREHWWLVDWETAVAQTGGSNILTLKLRARSESRFQVSHKLEGNAWTPTSYRFEIDRPFEMEMDAMPWAAHLIQRADGSMTGIGLLEAMKTEGAIAPDTPASEFARMLATMVSGGFLEVVQ